MLYVVCWMLMGMAVVTMILHSIDQADRRRIDQANRAYKAALHRAHAIQQDPPQTGVHENNADVRDWSCRRENGPQIAKTEGVQRERGNH